MVNFGFLRILPEKFQHSTALLFSRVAMLDAIGNLWQFFFIQSKVLPQAVAKFPGVEEKLVLMMHVVLGILIEVSDRRVQMRCRIITKVYDTMNVFRQ